MKIDPDYPRVMRFFPEITDTVFEYRLYILIAPWGLLLAYWLPLPVLAPLIVLWAFQSWKRAFHYTTELRFWEQCFHESPEKFRVRHLYVSRLIYKIQDRYKLPGVRWDDPTIQDDLYRATSIIEAICHQPRRE